MLENLTKECQFVLIVENGEQPVISIGLVCKRIHSSVENAVVFYIKNVDCWLNHVH